MIKSQELVTLFNGCSEIYGRGTPTNLLKLYNITNLVLLTPALIGHIGFYDTPSNIWSILVT